MKGLSLDYNKLIQGNCLNVMKTMDDECIDLTVTSPPYGTLRKYNGYSFDFEPIAKELYRLTKPGGVLVWVVGDGTKNGSESGTSFKQALYFKECGFDLYDTMLFAKKNPIPLTHRRYEQHFEYMFVLSKGRPKTFNPIMEFCKSSQKRYKISGKVKEESKRSRDELVESRPFKQKGNIWYYTIGASKGETGNHPAPFPCELARDHITSWSNEGDVVLDPFAGSGTTPKMAMQYGRRFVAIEMSSEYCDIIKMRLDGAREEIEEQHKLNTLEEYFE